MEMGDLRMEVEEGEDIEAEKALMGRMCREEEMDDLKENEADTEYFRDGKQDSGSGSHAKYKEKVSDSEKHRSKERKKERRAEKEHDSKDRERSVTHKETRDRDKDLHYHEPTEKERVSNRDRRREEREEHVKKEREKDKEKEKRREKDYDHDKYRERDRERDRDVERELERGRDRGREREKGRERDRDREHERSKLQDREREKERAREKDLEREKEREKDRERERGRGKGKDREKGKERAKNYEESREREKEHERDKLVREKDREKHRDKDRDKERTKERGKDKLDGRNWDQVSDKELNGINERELDEKLRGNIVYNYADRGNEDDDYDKVGEKHSERNIDASSGQLASTKEIEKRIMKMKEERKNKDTEDASEVLAWVTKSRRLGEKKLQAERHKAQQLAKVFEEQDNMDQEESEDERAPIHSSKDLAGVKILHGLDRVAEGGAVVLTLKDQSILANGDINEEVDMLESVEIGEQKQREDAYKAAKKKTGIYVDKFNDDPGLQRTILPQYDDPVRDEGVTLNESGHFTVEAEKKLEELRKRLQGSTTSYQAADLTTSGKFSSDYYTHEEMLQFKKPKKKKSLRKKNKLDLDALEAEATSAGLGATDHGTRNEAKRQSAKEQKEKAEAEMRNIAYQLASAKAEEASKALWMEQTLTIKSDEEENPVFGEDDELNKSIEEARKLALKKQEASAVSVPQAVAVLATSSNQLADDQNREDRGEKKVVFTEMNEFVWKLQLNEETVKAEPEDVFMDEEVAPESVEKVAEVEAGGWMEVKESGKEELSIKDEEVDAVPDNTIQEPVVGKGLSGVLQLLKDRGTLKETVDWGGRNMDKKKSKLVGIADNNGQKEIRIERTDEFGRIMTPKEAFRVISHKFHGKGPGKMKLEKRMKQYQEELKLKQMKASDTPLLSMEKMREAQARMQSPYLVLSGHVKPGQTSDPRGFATVEKDQPGSLTPMLGDKKVEHFLGIKRKAEPSHLGHSKKPKA